MKQYFLAAIFLIFLSCGVVSAETSQGKPIEVSAELSLIYDDNVFSYSKRVRDAFRANLRPIFFWNQNANSLGDIITKPSFDLRFNPQNYSTRFSASVSGSFYRDNDTLNDRSYFIEIKQGLGTQTDISLTYDELFIDETFRTVGVDIQHNFILFEGNIFADGTGDDKNYGAGLTTSIPSQYVETSLSYQFNQAVPVDSTFALRSHQFRVEPIFPLTESLSLNLYANIQKDKYTSDVREDTTRGWGVLMDYAMSEKFTAQLGFDRIRWRTDKVISNASYGKNIITIKVTVSL